MGKVITKGFAKSAEGGQFAGAIITGANLRRSSEKKPPPGPKGPTKKAAAATTPERSRKDKK